MSTASMHHLFNYDIVVQALGDLTHVMRTEIDDIRANNIKTITENFSFKNDLIQYVEAIKELLSKNPDITKSLSTEQKLTLKNMAQELQESVTLNNSELMKAKYFNDELIKLVVAAVENASTPMKTYDRYGKRPKHSKLRTPTSMTLNEEI